MALRITRVIMTLVGLVGGLLLGHYGLLAASAAFGFHIQSRSMYAVLVISVSVLFALIGFIIARPMLRGIIHGTKWVEQRLQKMPFPDLIAGTIGLILGLLVAFLLSSALMTLPLVGAYMPLLASLILGYLGASLGYRWRERIALLLEGIKTERKRDKTGKKNERLNSELEVIACPAHAKVLDTSVIIDGRIVEICRSGFLEGPLIITDFVLDELRHIADSSDSQKRNRGRRGLDILNELRKLDVEVQSLHVDYDNITEVDSKLVRLAHDLGGYVVTNDFNLNKVASFHKVRVLNVNELAGAIKTVLLPGEAMRVEVVAKGKEAEQGVGYLDDGTMIVVESGRKHIGKTVDAVVTSVIQTNAGRMIFVRLA